MSSVRVPAARRRLRLIRTASLIAVATALTAGPAQSQLVRFRGGEQTLGNAAGARPAGGIARSVSMREALAQQVSTQQRAAQIRSLVTGARQAAAASVSRITPTDGLGERGLHPIAGIQAALRARAAGNQAEVARRLNDALAANDIARAPDGTVDIVLTKSGRNTWDGAGLPDQTVDSSGTTVTITQTQSRAVLSWERFDVGAGTTVQFNQKQAGVAQRDWVAVNRVVAGTDPTTILGKVNADGQVFILNRNGVIFGKGAQLNLGGLLASSLDLGNFASGRVSTNLPGDPVTLRALGIRDRNQTFLQSGVFSSARNPTFGSIETPPLILSSIVGAGELVGTTTSALPLPSLEGGVFVDPGATITTLATGSIILAAPQVQNHGILQATDGQVSLVGGRFITFATLTGEDSSRDPNVRGLFLRAIPNPGQGPAAPSPSPEQLAVLNRGLIQSRRGYLSLVTSATGEIVNDGMLEATTSVSRNGKIALYGGRVTIGGSIDQAAAGAIVVSPDEAGETIPQGSTAEPPRFRRSQIEIGTSVERDVDPGVPQAELDPIGQIGPSIVTFGQNTLLYAPNAQVSIGRRPERAFDLNSVTAQPSRIEIAEDALFDVSGLKDVKLDTARNFLTISPVKRNELRDTPTYREVALNGEFTLNGTILTVDVRRSGVRSDGVRWIGSPLLEAGSLASQIPVTVSELMTQAGEITLGVNPVAELSAAAVRADPALADTISVARGATFDVSGGWVSYSGGQVTTSRLRTADGRIVDIGDADPNDRFVAVVDGFTENQPRFGIVNRFQNGITEGGRLEGGYDEGRDAGALRIDAPFTRFEGLVRGRAFAGSRQAINGQAPDRASLIAGDTRRLQSDVAQLPAGALLQLGTSSEGITQFGANFVIGAATARAERVTVLSDAMLSAAGLSALTLRTSGGVRFAEGSAVELAPGGVLTIEAGRAIRFDGSVRAAGGVIDVVTTRFGEKVAEIGEGSRLGTGSIFTADDDITSLYAALPGEDVLGSFDIRVAGTLNTAGRWTNDSRAEDLFQGPGWLSGGTIRLEVAPRVLAALGEDLEAAQIAVDLSGSIVIADGATLNVSAGGYAGIDERLTLSGAGGAIRLINRTRYSSTLATLRRDDANDDAFGDLPLDGTNQTVGFTPLLPEGERAGVVPSLVPNIRRSVVRFNESSLSGFGFSNGGTLELVSPDISFGADGERRAGATHVGIDASGRFDLSARGFGAFDLSSSRSRFVEGLFNNGRGYISAIAETTTLRVRQGQTLNLSQQLLPLATSREDVSALLGLASGGDVLSVLTPRVPALAIDRRPINLTLGGLSELVVDRGATLTSEPGARITAPKILNFGTISLPGGELRQDASVPSLGVNLFTRQLGVRSLAELLGREQGASESAPNALGIDVEGRVLTNVELFREEGSDRIVVLLGDGESSDGIRLAAGSVTDLSGAAIFDPRARFIQDPVTGAGRQERVGRLIGGGSIATLSTFVGEGESTALEYAARNLIAEPGAIVDISGARAVFDEFVPGRGFTATDQWSSAGRIAALSGGSIAGARTNAFGGYGEDGGNFLLTGAVDLARAERRALGGTLEWRNPTIRDTLPDDGALNVLLDGEIEAAGFDTLIARGGMRLAGQADLTLGKSLLVTGATDRNGQIRVGELSFIRAEAGAIARVAAPRILFAARPAGVSPSDLVLGDPRPSAPGEVSFVAGVQGIDFIGSTRFGPSIGSLSFETSADIRLVGIDQRTAADRETRSDIGFLNGAIVSFADMRFAAARTYATTGSGNLQAFVDSERATGARPSNVAYQPFTIAVSEGRTVSFERTVVNDDAPLSAGSYIQVSATRIEQNGHLAAPIGRIEFNAVEELNFGPDSLTSVAGGPSPVPYGTTLDLKEYYFTPANLNPLVALPQSEMRLGAESITVQQGARVDLSGGGDVFAFEFVSGVGGSRDVLDRINTDTFSSNDFDTNAGRGFQFADRRQVFAIVPRDRVKAIADYDPIYSADYGATGPVDIYGRDAGLSITIDAAGDLPAGEYLLLPAHYALLPGAYRVVENVGDNAPAPGTTRDLLDGSLVVSGQYGFVGTGRTESVRRAFTVQSSETFRRYSRLETRSGSDTLADQAEVAGLERPRLPIDAGRLTLNRFGSFDVAGLFLTTPSAGGRGTQVDISAPKIRIAPAGTASVAGAVTLIDTTLNALNAESLFIGGLRVANADGTTDLRIFANEIDVLSNAFLAAPELLFAVGNERNREIASSRLVIGDGATLRALGSIEAGETSDYVIQSFARGQQRPSGFESDGSGSGSTLRVANGPERLVRRTGPGERNARTPATFRIGDAILEGQNVVIESTRLPRVLEDVDLRAPNVALIGDQIRFGETITPLLESKLAASQRLTLSSPDPIAFAPGTHRFNNLVIDAPAIELGSTAEAGDDLVLQSASLRLFNRYAEAGRCFLNCGSADSDLGVTATEISFGSGKVRTFGFGGNVRLTSSGGMFYEGEGALDVGTARLTLATPFVADRALADDPRTQAVRPDYTFGSRNGFLVENTGFRIAFDAISGARAPGARLTFGGSDAIALGTTDQERDIAVAGATLLASAGTVVLDATRDIDLSGGAEIATPGFSKTFGDELDRVTVAASGGTIDMIARAGGIRAAADTTLISDTGIGNAGAIKVRAPIGTVVLDSRINPDVSGARSGDFVLDAGASDFNLTRFATQTGALFQGDVSIRTGLGDLILSEGARLRAESVSLTADSGTLTVAGTIDTSGVDVTGLPLTEAASARVAGGPISLYGRRGVVLTGTALLDTHTNGYAETDPRSAAAGDISIGIDSETAQIRIEPGARLDLGARRTEAALAAGLPGARLVAETVKAQGSLADVTAYRLVEADAGGVLTLRAPLIGAASDQVDISIGAPASISGARDVQVEAFRRYDIDFINNNVNVAGLVFTFEGLGLDPSANAFNPIPYENNFLSSDFVTEEGFASIPNFIRNFQATARDGTPLSAYRVRPGVEFTTEGALSLTSQWNLAAADIDYEGAAAAGLVQIIDRLGQRFTSYGLIEAGQRYYSVVPGKEGELLDSRFVNFYFRTDTNGDGRGDARGEAPVVRFRTGGDLRIERSISDGFFVFRDRSDQAWIDYQFGGGTRSLLPAVQFFCGSVQDPTCAPAPRTDAGYDPTRPGLARFGDTLANGGSALERAARSVRVNINFVTGGEGLDFGGLPAPLAPEANSPAVLGTQDDQFNFSGFWGAPLEYGELFPLLPGGTAMRSSDISLIAGATAGNGYSTNPYHVISTSSANLVVTDAKDFEGELVRGGYQLKASDRATLRLRPDDLQLRFFREVERQPIVLDLNGFFEQASTAEDFAIGDLQPDAYGVLNWGNPAQSQAAADAAAAAAEFFEGRTFLGTQRNRSGVIAPFTDILTFLEGYENTLLQKIADGVLPVNLGSSPNVTRFSPSSRVLVQTVIRTGDGRIAVAAARDVDLRDAEDPVYRLADGSLTGRLNETGALVGGTSIYTAGQRVAQTPIAARLSTGGVATVTPTSDFFIAGPEFVNTFPSPLARTEAKAVFAHLGGDVSVFAGRDILGRRDLHAELFRNGPASGTALSINDGVGIDGLTNTDGIGAGAQLWRVGQVGTNTEAALAPQYFTTGVGALAGGDVRMVAGRDMNDVAVALNSSVSSETIVDTQTLVTWGGGDLSVEVGRDLIGGRFDLSSGQAKVLIGRDSRALTREVRTTVVTDTPLFRLENATAQMQAGRAVAVDAAGLGVTRSNSLRQTDAGLFSATTGLEATALIDVRFGGGQLAPPSLKLTSLTGDVTFERLTTLYPSPIGQLSLLAAGDLRDLSLAMLDLDPTLLAQSAFASGLNLGTDLDSADLAARFPGVNAIVDENVRRLYHNNRITHAGDREPVRIHVDGSIENTSLNFPKVARITAGDDIVDMYFVGQNVDAQDETRISAGRDIAATSRGGVATGTDQKPYFGANGFYLGGPGSFSVEAGRNLGPFITSAVISGPDRAPIAYGGGIMTLGNELNPWLGERGADLNIQFGTANGADLEGMRDTYLKPENFARLDGDLFVQVTDAFGNDGPDRTRPIYAPVLARWLRTNAPDAFTQVFGTRDFATDAELTDAAYGSAGALYTRFAALPLTRQRRFLINELYFGELKAPGEVDGPSYLQYIRGYRAVEALFPARLGYTDNLALYEVDPSTIDEDNPLGVPTRRLSADGQPAVAELVRTGDADLRLATFQTARGGAITILAPGGDILAGSVVRTAEQVDRRNTRFFFRNAIVRGGQASDVIQRERDMIEFGGLQQESSSILSIPLGLEGVLTLRSGAVQSFTDGDFRLNQSRLFTNGGGDITAWSSNGDLNAGQGPKSAASFPPVTVRFSPNGFGREDTGASISGAGIGSFKTRPDDPAADITLIAPVGEVDAGDAGVRASGDIVVAAARVANADAFEAAGDITGVPTSAPSAAAPPPASAASQIAAQVARIADANRPDDRRSVIVVDVTGFAGGDRCRDPNNEDPNCPK